MGLGQEANNLKKEIDKDIRSSGWGGLVFYSLFLIFIIGCVIYALGSWTETPAVPKDSTGSSVTDRSEQEQQQQNKQKKKVTKVKISKNYYIILPETADLKSKTKKDNVTEKTYYFFGKEDKSTLLRIISEKDDGEFPQNVWSRYKDGESELSYVMFFNTAAAIHEDEEVIECWWPDGKGILCHVRLTGGNIDGYTEVILNTIRKKGEPNNTFDAEEAADIPNDSKAPPGAMEEYYNEMYEDAYEKSKEQEYKEYNNYPKDPFGG